VKQSGPSVTVGGHVQGEQAADDEDDTIRPLLDRLVSELTAARTVALRNALAGKPPITSGQSSASPLDYA